MNLRQEKSSKRSCLFLLLLFFVVLPFSVVALVLLLWFGREAAGNRLLKARMTSLANQGYPVDDASAEVFYKDRTDPTDANSWLEILATAGSAEFGASTEGVPVLGNVAEPPVELKEEWKEERAARDFLEKWKSLRSDATRLSKDAKPVRFPIVFDSFNTIDTNRMGAFRTVGRLLYLQGIVAMRDGDTAGVRDSVGGLLGLARVNAGEPMVVSQLVSQAIDGMALGLLKDAIRFDLLHEVDLRLLLPQILELSNFKKDWETAFAGERALALPLFIDRRKANAAGVTPVMSNSRDAILYIDLIESILDVPMDDLSEFKTRLQAIEANLEMKTKASFLAQLDSIMTKQTMPSGAALGEAFIRSALQHRLAAIAIGLRLYEKKHGKLPSELKQLSELSMDLQQVSPTKNRSFGYRLEGSNAKLWGGSLRDVFGIPEEPPMIAPESPDTGSPDREQAEFWTWELRKLNTYP